MFSVPYIEQCVQNKQQTKFWLGDNEAQNKLSLQVMQQEALKLNLTHDTNRVVAAVLLPSCKFKDFVGLINLCLINEHKRYALAKDTFYIFADPPPFTGITICGGVIIEVIHVEEQPSGMREQMKKVFEEYVFPYWYWWCLYGALIWGTVFRLKRSIWLTSGKKNFPTH